MKQNVPFLAPTRVRALRLLFILFGKFQLDAVLVRSRQVALVGEVLDNLEEQRKIFALKINLGGGHFHFYFCNQF